MSNTTASQVIASYCNLCDCMTAVVLPVGGNVGVPFEYEPDGFTASAIRHVCWPREERIGRLITARRELMKSQTTKAA